MTSRTPWSAFFVEVPGKWVLAGEHAVLRGATAVALPLPDRFLTLDFKPARDGGLTVEPSSSRNLISDILSALEDRWQNEDKSFPRPQGTLTLKSTIPLGAGMGSSAALCVALTLWMKEPLALADDEVFEFAKQLEHRFHGRSSGMDVAVILARQPISFSISRGARPLFIKNQPPFEFHDTGLRARTSDCVQRVEIFTEENPMLALQIDEKMGAASRDATEGLILYDRGEKARGLETIAQAMRKASACYEAWGLVPTEVRDQQALLLANGASAVKLTGAGAGGFLISLTQT